MTGLLEEAIRRLQSLPTEEQDAIASQIIETLGDENGWAERFQRTPTLVGKLAEEAVEEHQRGETLPIDELMK